MQSRWQKKDPDCKSPVMHTKLATGTPKRHSDFFHSFLKTQAQKLAAVKGKQNISNNTEKTGPERR